MSCLPKKPTQIRYKSVKFRLFTDPRAAFCAVKIKVLLGKDLHKRILISDCNKLSGYVRACVN